MKHTEILESYWDDNKTLRQYLIHKVNGKNKSVQWWFKNGTREVIGTAKQSIRHGSIIWFTYEKEKNAQT